jgi:lysophospholipid acyltransferase (LPLAT)-like uncharacterized protein
MTKRWPGTALAHETIGLGLAAYLGLVRRTTRFVSEPADIDKAVAGHTPVIVAMWHGQHLMISFAWPRSIGRVAALISRHADAGAQAVALRHLGVAPVRGSGGRPRAQRRKGGVLALRELQRHLDAGVSVAMTADLPKRPRIAGLGIVMLARLSGRPIVPTAVVSSRRFDFNSWDRASLGKPFARGAIVIGDFVHVAANADDAALEAARRAVEAGLDAVHSRAYALVGARDPGAELRPA